MIWVTIWRHVVSVTPSPATVEKFLINVGVGQCLLRCLLQFVTPKVDMESFLSDIGFSSLHNISIDTLPSAICKVMILGVPLGGTSIFDLPKRPLDYPFVKEWFKQFDPKPLKEIRACNIAEKLVLTKTVDFLFKVNFLMLFANVMGTADTIKAIVNLTVL
ncbi:hypothetical protein Tco_0974462 [Tanacetum coccineum]|uniref:Uncharacterized protein n=1 Tax=Tanacetum coccineum TaxID=301880 RepID=A0ABQ5EBM5_9ASTR